ncbi:MAG TPA: TonB-dependent receptor, partial [Gammaproteobacteria bacterium]|nr:TonB-dependent receptor [Gammaproteobacteria bacterium]
MNRNLTLPIVAGLFLAAACPVFASVPDQTSATASAGDGDKGKDKAINLGNIQVEGRAIPSLATPSIKDARERLARVPGGTTLIDAEAFRDSPVRNLEDVLTFAPGVFVQSRFGGSETRTSIRGSGISLTYSARGIRFLRDGLPLNFADGFFNPELVQPLTTRYVEVYRGANALQYGAAALGGAINFVTETGYTAPPARVRIGFGSNGYIHPQASFAKTFDTGWDVFGSLSALHQDGLRPQSEEDQRQAYANIGYRHSDNAESRLHVNIQHSRLELPGSLTKAQIAADPTQANPTYTAAGAFRHIDVRRFAFQQSVRFDRRDQLDMGVFYQDFSLHHPLPFFVLEEHRVGSGVSLRQTLHGRLAAYVNRLIVGGRLARGTDDFKQFAPAGHARKGPLRLAGEKTALAGEVFAEDQLHLTEAVTLVAGAQFAYASRKSNISFGHDPDTNQSYTGFSPKIGATWQATPAIQLYGNLSRSFEPPTFNQLRNPVAG